MVDQSTLVRLINIPRHERNYVVKLRAYPLPRGNRVASPRTFQACMDPVGIPMESPASASVDVRSTFRETCFRFFSCHTLSSSAILLTFMSYSATYVSVKGPMDSLQSITLYDGRFGRLAHSEHSADNLEDLVVETEGVWSFRLHRRVSSDTLAPRFSVFVRLHHGAETVPVDSGSTWD